MTTHVGLRPVSADEARELLEEAGTVVETEMVGLEGAAGRVLAESLVAHEDMPSFPRSAMDGYAVRAADVAAATAAAPVSLSLVGSVTIGRRPGQPVWPGEAQAIPTGGHLPDGADAVVMVEQAEERGAAVEIRRPVEAGRNVIRAGEDIPRGSKVLPSGRLLRPSDVSALAAFGLARVPVHRRPRVSVLSTGNEISPPADPLQPGKVRDVNQYALGAQAASAGCEVHHDGIIEDDPAALEWAVRAAAAKSDVVLLSGGSSVGGHDYTSDVFKRLGPPGLLFHGIAVRPGRPTLVSRAGPTLLVGMPGVPTSAMVIFEVFIRPLLRRMGGEKIGARWSAERHARLATAYTSEIGREDYLRVRLVEREGEIWAEPLPGGSAALSNVLAADGLVTVPADVTTLAEGDAVTVSLFT